MIKHKTMPMVAIIGRTNVGKSTLFNRLIEEAKAIVSPIPGTTRDVLYGTPVWRGKTFSIVDTAGLDIEGKDELERNVLRQVERAKEEAALLLLVLDTQAGIMPEDRLLIKELMASGKPFIVAANKADNERARQNLAAKEWHTLPVGKIFPVSAKNGAGAGDLLDEIFSEMKKNKIKLPDAGEKEKDIRVAIIGKPNVGKSSLLNALLGKETAVVSAMPHTTREPQDTTIEYGERNITLIDTAGVRKKARVEAGLEKIGVRKSLDMITKADIVLLVLDISEPLGVQDKHLFRLIQESSKGTIIIANKIDLVKQDDWRKIFSREIMRHFPFLNFAPVIFVSAKTHEKVNDIYDEILAVQETRERRLDLHELEKFIKELVRKFKPIKHKGVRHPYIFGMKQTGTEPPKFFITIKEKTSVHPSYIKFLEKQIRERFGFAGTPIIIETRHIKI
jgi:GTP-binding protein